MDQKPWHSDRATRQSDRERLRLTTDDLTVHFARVKAVEGIALNLEQGTIVGLIGPNGAGKTTMANAITGFQRPTRGTIQVGDKDATKWSPQRYARAGIVRTFQNARLFGGLTTVENVEVAALGVGAPRSHARQEARRLVELMGLSTQSNRRAGSLPYGDQRRLSIARALACRPKIMLLDEPAAGLDEAESDDLLTTLGSVRDSDGCGMMLIEHDMRLVMQLCDRIHVLDYGQTLKVGTPAEVQNDERVLAAYLGLANHRSRSRTVIAS